LQPPACTVHQPAHIEQGVAEIGESKDRWLQPRREEAVDSKLWREVTDLKLASSVGIHELGTHEESEVEPNPEEIEDDPQIERQFKQELQQ